MSSPADGFWSEAQGPAGAPGADGAPGAPGADGHNAYTSTTANAVAPAVGANVTIAVGFSLWAVQGQAVYIESAGYYTIADVPDAAHLEVTNTGWTGNAAPGTVVAPGADVGPAGIIGPQGPAGGGDATLFWSPADFGYRVATFPGNNNFAVGMLYQVQRSTTVAGVRTLVDLVNGGDVTVSVWDQATSVRLATGTATFGAGRQIVSVPLAAPLALVGPTLVYLSVYTQEHRTVGIFNLAGPLIGAPLYGGVVGPNWCAHTNPGNPGWYAWRNGDTIPDGGWGIWPAIEPVFP